MPVLHADDARLPRQLLQACWPTDGDAGGSPTGGGSGGSGGEEAPAAASASCNPSNCNGCCDSSGACRGGNTYSACGIRGAACVTCPAGRPASTTPARRSPAPPARTPAAPAWRATRTPTAATTAAPARCARGRAVPRRHLRHAQLVLGVELPNGCCDGTVCNAPPTDMKCGGAGNTCVACAGSRSVRDGPARLPPAAARAAAAARAPAAEAAPPAPRASAASSAARLLRRRGQLPDGRRQRQLRLGRRHLPDCTSGGTSAPVACRSFGISVCTWRAGRRALFAPRRRSARPGSGHIGADRGLVARIPSETKNEGSRAAIRLSVAIEEVTMAPGRSPHASLWTRLLLLPELLVRRHAHRPGRSIELGRGGDRLPHRRTADQIGAEQSDLDVWCRWRGAGSRPNRTRVTPGVAPARGQLPLAEALVWRGADLGRCRRRG